MRASPIVTLHLMLALASAARAQGPSSPEPAPDSTMRPSVIGRWVLDSTPTRKHRRQTYVAATAAIDTVVGEFRATRPIMRIYCHDNARLVGLEIYVGQQIYGSLPGLTVGSHVGKTEVLIQRDSQPEQKAGWLYDLDKQVMGPGTRDQAKTIEALGAAREYRIGVMLYKAGRRYMTFDLTDAAERIAWVSDHCGAKGKD